VYDELYIIATIMIMNGPPQRKKARNVQNEKGVEKHSERASQYSPQQL
jgi:hypothetical protein